ncbi:MAG TPA: serine hydrolase domain-containing protein [Allosphingosinicella sp.]|nr:serine hydrolase domain-containing protein [Allosphingosinicella sp.]
MLRGRLPIYLLIGLVVAVALWGITRGRQPAEEAAENKASGPRFTIPVGNEAPPPGAVDYARLDQRLQRLMQDRQMVGLAVGVVENGEIRFLKGYGVTLAGSGEAVTPSTVFRWASLSKGVAGDIVARLAADGALSLTDPISRYAASVRLPGGNENMVTLADILSHTTGLFGHAEDPRLEEGMDPHLLRASMALLHNTCAPGTCHAYQNVLFDAASEAVERVTGKPYGEVLRERFFAPLGMTTASSTRAELMAARSWARGHVGGNPQTFEISESYYRVPAAGGVNGSIQDLSIWMLANMGRAPDVLTPAMLQQVQTPRIATPGENRRRSRFSERTASTQYGLGWRIMDYAGHRVIGHHGGVKGYRSMILFDPSLKAGVVVLWNSATSRPNGIEYEVMDMVYRLPFRDWLFLDTPQPGRGGERAAERVADAPAGRERPAREPAGEGRRRPGR